MGCPFHATKHTIDACITFGLHKSMWIIYRLLRYIESNWHEQWGYALTYTDWQHRADFVHGIAICSGTDVWVVRFGVLQTQFTSNVLNECFHSPWTATNTHELRHKIQRVWINLNRKRTLCNTITGNVSNWNVQGVQYDVVICEMSGCNSEI